MTEADTGGAPVDQYTNVSSNTTTNGTITSWANMQSASDGGAYATVTEAGHRGRSWREYELLRYFHPPQGKPMLWGHLIILGYHQ